MRHDLFVPQGGEVLLLESGAGAETRELQTHKKLWCSERPEHKNCFLTTNTCPAVLLEG